MRKEKAIIIVAGGKGTRMNSLLPKQYLCLGNKPILMHTLERFYAYDEQIHIILVLPKADHDFWKELCSKHQFNIEHTLASGGDTRFNSVKNGVDKLTTEEVVGVHDGVRPFVSIEVIRACYDNAKLDGAVIPVLPVFETLRQKSTHQTVDRDDYCLVQTPQVFKATILKQAYEQVYRSAFTDDASVVEALGVDVKLIEGNRENIKMTTPYDLKIGEILLDD